MAARERVACWCKIDVSGSFIDFLHDWSAAQCLGLHVFELPLLRGTGPIISLLCELFDHGGQ